MRDQPRAIDFRPHRVAERHQARLAERAHDPATRRHGRLADPRRPASSLPASLPVACIACGHDAHTAMLVQPCTCCTSPRRARRHCQFMFQPGEGRPCRGSAAMIEDGLLAPIRSPPLLCVPSSQLQAGAIVGRPGPCWPESYTWTIRVKGRGGHASMRIWRSIRCRRLRNRLPLHADGHPPR